MIWFVVLLLFVGVNAGTIVLSDSNGVFQGGGGTQVKYEIHDVTSCELYFAYMDLVVSHELFVVYKNVSYTDMLDNHVQWSEVLYNHTSASHVPPPIHIESPEGTQGAVTVVIEYTTMAGSSSFGAKGFRGSYIRNFPESGGTHVLGSRVGSISDVSRYADVVPNNANTGETWYYVTPVDTARTITFMFDKLYTYYPTGATITIYNGNSTASSIAYEYYGVSSPDYHQHVTVESSSVLVRVQVRYNQAPYTGFIMSYTSHPLSGRCEPSLELSAKDGTFSFDSGENQLCSVRVKAVKSLQVLISQFHLMNGYLTVHRHVVDNASTIVLVHNFTDNNVESFVVETPASENVEWDVIITVYTGTVSGGGVYGTFYSRSIQPGVVTTGAPTGVVFDGMASYSNIIVDAAGSRYIHIKPFVPVSSITISWLYFHLHRGSTKDFVSIYEGSAENENNLLGTFTLDSRPMMLTVNASAILVKYHAYYTGTHPYLGWKFQYFSQPLSGVCDVKTIDLVAKDGKFGFGSQRGPLLPNQECSVSIKGVTSLQLGFEYFDVGVDGSFIVNRCVTNTGSCEVIGNYSDDTVSTFTVEVPEVLESEITYDLYMTVKTGPSVSTSRAIEGSYYRDGVVRSTHTFGTPTGVVFDGMASYADLDVDVTGPRYIHIKPFVPVSSITISWLYFHLHRGSTNDFVSIYEGSAENENNLLGTFTLDSRPMMLTVNASAILVKYHAYYTGTHPYLGWKFQYTSKLRQSVCKPEMTTFVTPSGKIYIGGDHAYPPNCKQMFVIERFQALTIMFETFDLGGGDVLTAYTELESSMVAANVSLPRFREANWTSGPVPPPSFFSITQVDYVLSPSARKSLLLVFESDSVHNGAGVVLSFKQTSEAKGADGETYIVGAAAGMKITDGSLPWLAPPSGSSGYRFFLFRPVAAVTEMTVRVTRKDAGTLSIWKDGIEHDDCLITSSATEGFTTTVSTSAILVRETRLSSYSQSHTGWEVEVTTNLQCQSTVYVDSEQTIEFSVKPGSISCKEDDEWQDRSWLIRPSSLTLLSTFIIYVNSIDLGVGSGNSLHIFSGMHPNEHFEQYVYADNDIVWPGSGGAINPIVVGGDSALVLLRQRQSPAVTNVSFSIGYTSDACLDGRVWTITDSTGSIVIPRWSSSNGFECAWRIMPLETDIVSLYVRSMVIPYGGYLLVVDGIGMNDLVLHNVTSTSGSFNFVQSTGGALFLYLKVPSGVPPLSADLFSPVNLKYHARSCRNNSEVVTIDNYPTGVVAASSVFHQLMNCSYVIQPRNYFPRRIDLSFRYVNLQQETLRIYDWTGHMETSELIATLTGAVTPTLISAYRGAIRIDLETSGAYSTTCGFAANYTATSSMCGN